MWKSLIVIKPEAIWKFTPNVEGRYFRLRHIDPPKSPVGWVGQAEWIPNTSYHQTFELQRVNGLSVYECLNLPKPKFFSTRKLAFRQESRTPNNWLIEVEVNIEMPSYSLDDAPIVNPTAASTKNVTTVSVTTTPTKLLSANSNRKAVKFYLADKAKTVYLDTDNVVSATSALESLTGSKNVSVPYIIWQGEWWGVSTSGSASIEIEEYV